MKSLLICFLLLLFVSCSEQKVLSPSETANVVLESFHSKDNSTLKRYTTSDGYKSLEMIQSYVPESKDITFTILDESIDGETAWIKYNTSYDEKPGVFKLLKVDGKWMVTSKGPRERGPF